MAQGKKYQVPVRKEQIWPKNCVPTTVERKKKRDGGGACEHSGTTACNLTKNCWCVLCIIHFTQRAEIFGKTNTDNQFEVNPFKVSRTSKQKNTHTSLLSNRRGFSEDG